MKQIIYEPRKWNENEEMIVAVNAIYAIGSLLRFVILLLWLLSMKEEGIEKVTQINIILKYTKSLIR